jgi:hypothetical protein
VVIQNGESFAKMSDTDFVLLISSAGNLPVIKTKWVSRLKGKPISSNKYIARKAWHARESNTTEVEWYIS